MVCSKTHTIRAIKEKAWISQLDREHQLICYSYNLNLPKPIIEITDFESYWGQYNHNRRTITISARLIENHSWSSVIEILKHEIAHQMVFCLYPNPDHTHGHSFQDACEKICVAPWARKGAGPIISHQVKGEKKEKEFLNPLLRKLDALLKLSSSDNEFEAELALEKAEKLCMKHNLEAYSKTEDDELSFIVINHKRKRLPQHQSIIAHLLSEYFMVDCIFSSEYDAEEMTSFKTLEIIGSHHNLKIAEYVYFFLWQHLPKMWHTFKAENKTSTRSKNAFFLGILDGFEQKLKKQRLQNKATSSINQDISSINSTMALETIKEKNSIYKKKRYPKTKTRSVSSNFYDKDSYQHGIKQGQSLSVNPGIQKRDSEQIKYLPHQ